MSPQRLKKSLVTEKEKAEKEKSVMTAIAPVKPPKESGAAKVPRAGKTTVKSDHYVIFDYPAEGEVVSGLHYAIRLGASAGHNTVQVCIDGSSWQNCRHSTGYWWFDWGYFVPGKHTLLARIVDKNGKVLKKSLKRKVTVV